MRIYIVENPQNLHICTDKQWKLAHLRGSPKTEGVREKYFLIMWKTFDSYA